MVYGMATRPVRRTVAPWVRPFGSPGTLTAMTSALPSVMATRGTAYRAVPVPSVLGRLVWKSTTALAGPAQMKLSSLVSMGSGMMGVAPFFRLVPGCDGGADLASSHLVGSPALPVFGKLGPPKSRELEGHRHGGE